MHFKNLIWLSLSFVILSLDQWTKFLITNHLQFGEIFPLSSFFNLTLSFNTGAAFSFLSNAGGWQLVFFSLISVIAVILLLIWLCRLPAHNKVQAYAIALIIGGALGNLVDRLHWGYVVDFLDFHYQHWHFATFNIADSAICVGAALLILLEARKAH